MKEKETMQIMNFERKQNFTYSYLDYFVIKIPYVALVMQNKHDFIHKYHQSGLFPVNCLFYYSASVQSLDSGDSS